MDIDEDTFLEIRYIDPTDESKQAITAALWALFERYPLGYTELASTKGTWRKRALEYVHYDDFDLAFHFAHDTGIPDDELLSIALLFSK